MKGLTIIKATPSNAIDIYPLIEKAAAEALFEDIPSQKDLKSYYFRGLMESIASHNHFWYLAKRGRGYLGFIHGVLVPRRWDGAIGSMFIDTLFVVSNRRKSGIGRKLIDELKKDAQNIGVRRIDFLCPESQKELWEKKYKAQPIRAYMGVDL